jgi:hypothetical protein
VSTAVLAALWGCVSGVLAPVIYRRRVGRVLALCFAALGGACGYVGFRLVCGFHF